MQEESQKNEELQEITPIVEEKDLDKADYVFIPKGIHNYRQEGGYLVCRSCELAHAVFIGMNKLMVGLNEDGTPKLIKR